MLVVQFLVQFWFNSLGFRFFGFRDIKIIQLFMRLVSFYVFYFCYDFHFLVYMRVYLSLLGFQVFGVKYFGTIRVFRNFGSVSVQIFTGSGSDNLFNTSVLVYWNYNIMRIHGLSRVFEELIS